MSKEKEWFSLDISYVQSYFMVSTKVWPEPKLKRICSKLRPLRCLTKHDEIKYMYECERMEFLGTGDSSKLISKVAGVLMVINYNFL